MINQPLLTDIKYGRLPSSVNGCGWMAAYNLFRVFGINKSPQAVHDELEKGLKYNGYMGTGPNRLFRYIKTLVQGAEISYSRRAIKRHVSGAKAGIVLYLEWMGAHYVTFSRVDDDGRFRFFNADVGNEMHVDTFENFRRKYCRLPVVCVITVQ